MIEIILPAWRVAPLCSRLLPFSVSRQHPAKLLQGFSGASDLGTGLFEKLSRQRLATPIAELQQALNGAEIVSGRSQPLGELMA
jgi:hypothetical protein